MPNVPVASGHLRVVRLDTNPELAGSASAEPCPRPDYHAFFFFPENNLKCTLRPAQVQNKLFEEKSKPDSTFLARDPPDQPRKTDVMNHLIFSLNPYDFSVPRPLTCVAIRAPPKCEAVVCRAGKTTACPHTPALGVRLAFAVFFFR